MHNLQAAIAERQKELRVQGASYREFENEADLAGTVEPAADAPPAGRPPASVTEAELLEIYAPAFVDKVSRQTLGAATDPSSRDEAVARAAKALVYTLAGRVDLAFMSRDEARAARHLNRFYRSAELARKARAWGALSEWAWAAITIVMATFVACVALARRPHHSVTLSGTLAIAWGLAIAGLEQLLGGTWRLAGTLGTVAILLGGVGLLVVGRKWPAPSSLHVGPRSPAAWFALPAVVALATAGWLVQLNIAAHFHLSLRYIALKHFEDLLLALMAASALMVLWPHAGSLARVALPGLVHRGGWRAALRAAAPAAAGVTVAFVGAAFVKSELVLLLAILVFAAFFVQSEPAARVSPNWFLGLRWAKYVLVGYLLIMLVAYSAKGDFGPVFVLALVTAVWLAYLVSIPASAIHMAGLAAAFALIYAIGRPTHVAERIAMMARPFGSTRTDFAVLQWFREAAPPAGFPLGKVPWCGFGAEDFCPGLPAQLQSDYTFTALHGLLGMAGAWIVFGAFAYLMLVPLRDPHARPSASQPAPRSHWRATYPHAVAVWGCIVLLMQAIVTVLGNLMAFPLTGITFPLLSFGSGSLLMALAVASALLVTWERRPHG